MHRVLFRRSTLAFGFATICVLIAGCGTSGRPSGGDPFRGGGGGGGGAATSSAQARFVIDHNGRTGSDITAYVMLSGITRRRLGRVTMGETAEFRLTLGGVNSVYLLGQITGESDIRSRAFQIRDGQRVRWNIALNQIEFVREEAPDEEADDLLEP